MQKEGLGLTPIQEAYKCIAQIAMTRQTMEKQLSTSEKGCSPISARLWTVYHCHHQCNEKKGHVSGHHRPHAGFLNNLSE